MKTLEGKVAIVSGSGRGIGRAIAMKLAREGAKVVVNDLDAGPAEQTVADIKAAGGMALADCGTIEHARYSLECGVDAIGSTMSGYTPDSVKTDGPDFSLIEAMAKLNPAPVFAEGRVWTREDARMALDLGASFVVVGTAITNPTAITERFVAAMRGTSGE